MARRTAAQSPKVFDVSKPAKKSARVVPKPKLIDSVSTELTPELAPMQSIAPGDTPIVVRRQGLAVKRIEPVTSDEPKVMVYKKPLTIEEQSEQLDHELGASSHILELPKQLPQISATAAPTPVPAELLDSARPNSLDTDSDTDTKEAVSDKPFEEPAPNGTYSGQGTSDNNAIDEADVVDPGEPDNTKLVALQRTHNAMSEDTLQPTMYGTKEYFLPISTHTQSRNILHFVLWTVLLATCLLTGLLLAVDAGLIQSTIRLPFDLIPS